MRLRSRRWSQFRSPLTDLRLIEYALAQEGRPSAMAKLTDAMQKSAHLMTLWRRPPATINWRDIEELHRLLIDDAMLRPVGEELRAHLDDLGHERAMLARGQCWFSESRAPTVEAIASLNWVSSWDLVMAMRANMFDDRHFTKTAILRLLWQLRTYAEAVTFLSEKTGFTASLKGSRKYLPGTYPGVEAFATATGRQRRVQEIHAAIAAWIGKLQHDGVSAPDKYDWAWEPPKAEEAKPAETVELPKEQNKDLSVEVWEADQPTLRVIAGRIVTGKGFDASEAARWRVLESPIALTKIPAPTVVEQALAAEFPWMRPAIDRLVSDLELSRSTGARAMRLRPLLLVGPPGIGKSRFGRRLAEAFGVPFTMVVAGGSGDNRSLAGTSRGWATAEPSRVLAVMVEHKVANPIVMVDEIDKTGLSRQNGRLVDTLLGLIERETAARFHDECLATACDLSWVSWILTANDLATVPAPLLDRVSIVEVQRPAPEHFPAILGGTLDDLAAEWRAERWALPELEPETVEVLAAAFAAGHSIRRIRSAVVGALAASARLAPRH